MMEVDNGNGIDCVDGGDMSIVALELLNEMSKNENRESEDADGVQGEKALAEGIKYFHKRMNELEIDLATDDTSKEFSFIPHNTKFAILVRNTLGIYRQFYDPLPPTYPIFGQFADKLKSHIAQQFYDKNNEKNSPNHSSKKAIAGTASFLAGVLCTNFAMGLGGLSLIGVETIMGVLLGGFGVASLYKIGLNIYEAKKLQKKIAKELGTPMLCSEHFPALLICALDEENVLRPLYNAADGEEAKQLLAKIFNQWIEDGCKYEKMQKKEAKEKTSNSSWEQIFELPLREKMDEEKFDVEGEDDDAKEMGDVIHDEMLDEDEEYENGMISYP